MSLFAEQKRHNLAQVSADSEALTRKRLEDELKALENFKAGAIPAAEGDARPTAKERKVEAEARAETVVLEEQPAAPAAKKGDK